jgi:integrase
MSNVISTELLRRVRKSPPGRVTDYRDPKVPGFVLRARPSGVHSWRVQLPNRRWVSLGRTDEVSLADAREAAQTSRAHAALGHVTPVRKSNGDLTLKAFLDDTYEPWMRATYKGGTGQVKRVRAAFLDLLELPISSISTGRVDRWRADRRNRRKQKADATDRQLKGSTINRDLAALKAVVSRAVEWGLLSSDPLARIKRLTEDESAIVRYLSPEEEIRLRDALAARDGRRQAARVAANVWRLDRGYELWPEHGAYTDHLTPLVLLALNTGLRRGELFQLRWNDVQFTPGLLTVRGAGAKTGQTRHVPLNSEAAKLLQHWRGANVGPHDLVFAGASGREPLNNIKKAWAGIMKSANISAFRFHDLRHHAGSRIMPGRRVA